MKRKALFIKQIGWLSVIPQLIIFFLIIKVFKYFSEADYSFDVMFPSLLIFLSLSFGLRFGIPRAHRKGIKLTRHGNFRKAIPYFEESYSFFMKYQWIDKWRYLTLLSSSAISYREMALCNIAYCYGQSEDGAKSKEYYEKALKEFPGSLLAQSSLNMFKAAENIKK